MDLDDTFRVWRLLATACVLAACKPEQDEPPLLPPVQPDHPAAPTPTPAPITSPAAKPFTFAVLSDLHLPNPKKTVVRELVAELVARKPRFVVITGDFTNGALTDGGRRQGMIAAWWRDVTTELAPLREAGIPVLPVAGNHDSYLATQRAGYASAFADLDQWAKPLVVNASGKHPFYYSIDVDGVHLALAHIVSQRMDPQVEAWLDDDLAHARGARLRFVFGHVPLASVIRPPNAKFFARFGTLLAKGHADYYVAGHEHVSWDDNVALPPGGTLRQVLVGCSSGYYDFEPSKGSKERAACVPIKLAGKQEALRCEMPNGGGEFVLARGRKGRNIQHYKNSFTLITVDGDQTRVHPMTIADDGRAIPFYLNE